MKKIMHEQVDLPGGSPIKIKWDDFPHFDFPWHFHNEYEIVYVVESFGKRFVGDSIEPFDAGDLVLLGTNLPHFWKNDEVFYQGNPEYRVNAIVVQFSDTFLSEAVSNYPELNHIKDLFKRAERGIRFLGIDNEKIGAGLKGLMAKSLFERFVEFIRVLDMMAQGKHYKLLASGLYKKNAPVGTDERLNKILSYLNYHYQDKISLTEISDRFGMNATAFCRYFKEKTSKSLIGYVNDLRVGYACKLLQEGSMPVSGISMECGFNNLSNFNRIFKSSTGYTPSAYIEFLKSARCQILDDRH